MGHKRLAKVVGKVTTFEPSVKGEKIGETIQIKAFVPFGYAMPDGIFRHTRTTIHRT